MGLFWEIRQYQQIGEAKASAARASSKARDTAGELRYLEGRLEKLNMVCMAMWELLSERTDLTEEDLKNKVQEIDLRDGRADGRVTQKQIRRCPSCNRAMSRRHTTCMYCGSTNLQGSTFDGV